MTQTASAALARKLSVGQEGRGDKPRSLLRALRLAFARAAADRLQLPLSVIGAKQSCRTPNALTETVGADWLLLQFLDSDGGIAAICMDSGCVSAVVQVQTVGAVMPDSPSPRAFTDTDAAMVTPLIEDALSRAAALVDAPGDQVSLSGYEFAARPGDLRTLSLALGEDAYRVFDLTVELGGGLRQGQISVVLPDRPAETCETEAAQDDAGPNLEQASGVLRAELNTVICRMSLPLAALSQLQAGDVLPLTGSRLDRAEILTIDRTRAAVGRLGQCGGMRAVRMNEYAPLPAIAQTDAQQFLDAHSGMARQVGPDTPAPADLPLEAAMFDPIPPDETETDLNLADSDQMIAEISQLAGLTPLEDDPNGIG